MTLAQLNAKRADLKDQLTALNTKLNAFVRTKGISDAEKREATVASLAHAADVAKFDELLQALHDVDEDIRRYKAIQGFEASNANPVDGQEHLGRKVFASVESDPYLSNAAAESRGLTTNKGLALGGTMRMLALAGGHNHIQLAAQKATQAYGEQHPVTKALVTNIGGSGGYIVPPDQATEIIEVLRPTVAVRSAGPRTLAMPRGTMTLPAQTGAATATYSGEAQKITPSQQTFGQIIASYKKLTALVPGSNDLLRYSDPSADAIIRDDLVKVLGLREDLAFLVGDGTGNTPRGFLSFANQYAVQTGGTAGTFLSTANSTYATGGNFITSNETYTQATVANELAGAVNRLDAALVPDMKRMWFMSPRIYNYLNNLLNSLGLYVYRDELSKGMLLGYPIAKRTTQIPTNIYDTTGAATTASFIFLVEMTDAMILDAMQLELFVSREGGYTNSSGQQVNLTETDEFLVRAITEHDFQMRHPASVAVIQGVLWAPAIQ